LSTLKEKEKGWPLYVGIECDGLSAVVFDINSFKAYLSTKGETFCQECSLKKFQAKKFNIYSLKI
jgi:hypothetical protein